MSCQACSSEGYAKRKLLRYPRIRLVSRQYYPPNIDQFEMYLHLILIPEKANYVSSCLYYQTFHYSNIKSYDPNSTLLNFDFKGFETNKNT